MFDLFAAQVIGLFDSDEDTTIEVQFRRRIDRTPYDLSGLDGAVIGWRFNDGPHESDLMSILDAEEGRAEFTWGSQNFLGVGVNSLIQGNLHLEFFLVEGSDFIGSNTYVLKVSNPFIQ